MGQKMDKDSTATDKVLRLFRLLLSSDKQWYLPELADHLNCSPQTVLRLSESIEREMGESLQTGKDGKYRWYRLVPKSRPGRLALPKEELRLLEICQDLTEPFLLKSSLDVAEQDLQKLALLLSDEGAASQLHKKFVFCDKGYIDYQPYTATMEQLSRAISDKVVLDLEFTSLQQKKTIHYLWAPQVISAMNGALYVFGCELKPDLSVKERRFVAIHRITNLVWRDEHFSMPSTELDYKKLVLPWDKLRTYVIRFKPGKVAEYVRERTWASSEVKRDLDDGGLELEITTNNSADLHNWVQRFAPDSTLVSEQEVDFGTKKGAVHGILMGAACGAFVLPRILKSMGKLGSRPEAVPETITPADDAEAAQWADLQLECALYHGEL
ncbi:MAG TPA: WYL domain-containing protein [Candidatus Anaerobiospirillum stercoravium]|nr:WYL domain-containing protein [Candidatus Anaerobiospirillum stercoravium]